MTRLCSNILLGSLSDDDFSFLSPHLERVTLRNGEILAFAGHEAEFVVFPERGVISLMDITAGGNKSHIAMVGREGLTGSQFLLGCRQAAYESIVHVSGTGLGMSSDILLDVCLSRPSIHSHLLRYIGVLNMQTARTLSSNLQDSIESRVSRWLLMCHDRVEDDEIPLIHRHLGSMLGVRRATVTDAMHVLEGVYAIRCTRGRITIRDRGVLKEIAGTSYGDAEGHYSGVIAPFGDTCGAPEPSVHSPIAMDAARQRRPSA